MLSVTLQEFQMLVGTFMFAMTRVTGFVIAMPVIGTRMLNAKAKIGLIIFLSAAMFNTIPYYDATEIVFGEFLVIIACQFGIGIAMGMVLTMFFQVFVLAGEMVAMLSGLGMAIMNDPTSGATVPVISQFFLILVTVLFFLFDGHLRFIQLLHESFSLVPIGNNSLSADNFKQIALLGNWAYAVALKIAIPMVAGLLMFQVTMGYISKSAPQLNLFSIGFPLTMMLGLVVLYINVSSILPHFIKEFEYCREIFLHEMLGAEISGG